MTTMGCLDEIQIMDDNLTRLCNQFTFYISLMVFLNI